MTTEETDVSLPLKKEEANDDDDEKEKMLKAEPKRDKDEESDECPICLENLPKDCFAEYEDEWYLSILSCKNTIFK